MATTNRRLIGGRAVQINSVDFTQIQLRPPAAGVDINEGHLVVETSNRAALAGAGADFVMVALLGEEHGSVSASQTDGWNDDAPTQTIDRGGIPAFVGRGEVTLFSAALFSTTTPAVGHMITSGASGVITSGAFVGGTVQFGRVFRVREQQVWFTFDSFGRVLA